MKLASATLKNYGNFRFNVGIKSHDLDIFQRHNQFVIHSAFCARIHSWFSALVSVASFLFSSQHFRGEHWLPFFHRRLSKWIERELEPAHSVHCHRSFTSNKSVILSTGNGIHNNIHRLKPQMTAGRGKTFLKKNVLLTLTYRAYHRAYRPESQTRTSFVWMQCTYDANDCQQLYHSRKVFWFPRKKICAGKMSKPSLNTIKMVFVVFLGDASVWHISSAVDR